MVLLLAIVLDGLFGDPPNRFHPVAAMGSGLGWAVGHAPAITPVGQFVYGACLTLLGCGLSALAPVGLLFALQAHPWLALAAQVLLLKSVFSLRSLLEAGREVGVALQRDDLSEARRLVNWRLVSRDTRTLGRGHVASATVESLAENLSDSVVAPLLAYLVGGLPLAWAYRFVNTADAMIGYRDERFRSLGRFAARLDDVLNWIPARLSALLLVLAAPLVGGSARRAWRVMIADHGATASPNAGWPMSAAAGALGVTLEKTGHYRLQGGITLPDAVETSRARRLVALAGMGGVVIMLIGWAAAHGW